MKQDGTCKKSDTNYEMNGLRVGKSMKCACNGDVQECLDGLIYMNENGTLWKNYVAGSIILNQEETVEKAELYDKCHSEVDPPQEEPQSRNNDKKPSDRSIV